MTTDRRDGFIEHELLTTVIVLSVLVVAGMGISKLLGLHGRSALIPPAVGVGLLVVYVIVLNLVELFRE